MWNGAVRTAVCQKADALTREEYIAKLMIQKSEGKSSVKQILVALAKESEDMEQVIEELEEIIQKLKEEQ